MLAWNKGASLASAALDTVTSKAAASPLASCLVVHDDPELQSQVAGFVRRAGLALDADTSTAAALDGLLIEKLRSYVACFVVIEFSRREDADPLDIIARLRLRAPAVPVFVLARHGD